MSDKEEKKNVNKNSWEQQDKIKTVIQTNPIKQAVNPWIEDLSKTIKKTQTWWEKSNQISVSLDKYENNIIKHKNFE